MQAHLMAPSLRLAEDRDRAALTWMNRGLIRDSGRGRENHESYEFNE